MRRLLLLAPACAVLAGCAAAGPMLAADVVSAAVKAGVEYADKHRPTPDQALAQLKRDLLREKAEAGDPSAEYALALTLEGERDGEAEGWMCRAANHGLARAQLALGHWYNEDRTREDQWPYIDIRPDNSEAFVWYSLAATNGDPFAATFRDRLLARAMTPAQTRDAEARLASWEPSGCGPVTTARRGDSASDPLARP